MNELNSDIIVIGGGIAGVSAAAELSSSASVRLIESENQPGFHATGRSAAYFAKAYGNEIVRSITAASEPFYRHPPNGFCDVDLIRPRDCVFVGRGDQRAALSMMADEISSLRWQSPDDVRAGIPIFKEGYLAGGLLDSTGGDLDVDAILQGYLHLFTRSSGVVETNTRVNAIHHHNGLWKVHSEGQVFTATIVVNAAGAWADGIAELAGLSGLNITPKRRTAILINAPGGADISQWPLAVDVNEQFYFKPDAGQLLISPANEDECAPCDAQADEMDIAIAIDRFMGACDVNVERINHRWAGLRSFAPDKNFVVGFDPRQESFYWLAGQGGYGVQSAPGLAQLVANQITGAELPDHCKKLSSYTSDLAPERLIGPQPHAY